MNMTIRICSFSRTACNCKTLGYIIKFLIQWKPQLFFPQIKGQCKRYKQTLSSLICLRPETGFVALIGISFLILMIPRSTEVVLFRLKACVDADKWPSSNPSPTASLGQWVWGVWASFLPPQTHLWLMGLTAKPVRNFPLFKDRNDRGEKQAKQICNVITLA